MARLLLFIKHRLPFLWQWVELLNSLLFRAFHGDRLRKAAAVCLEECQLGGYTFRLLGAGDAPLLSGFLNRQDEARVRYFRAHEFDQRSVERVLAAPAFLAFGVFADGELVGYFFLRCFWNRKCFVGRIIDDNHEGRGIGRVMNQVMYHAAWRSGFRCMTTISRNNKSIMRAHRGNPHARVVKDLANDYILVEFVEHSASQCLTQGRAAVKRTFDLIVSAIGLVLTSWLILLAWMLASLDTGTNGMFSQCRVGRHGQLFNVFKIRTMRADSHDASTVTTARDPRITRLGRLWRKTKIDELPQLFNVLVGHMSFVGPRPDVPGFADRLQGEDRIVLSVRPGITGPATLRYRDEEQLLASVPDPEAYNRDVIFPDKVRINRDYVLSWSFWRDIGYIFQTLRPGR